MSSSQVSALSKAWRQHRLIRQLHLLGLYNTEIRNCGFDPDIAYQVLSKNPYKIVGISLEKADSIIDHLNLKLEPIERDCGAIVRRIHAFNKERGWTSTPLIMVLEMFSEFAPLAKKLRIDYGVVFFNDRLYMKHVFDMEQTVAKFLKKISEKKDDKLDILPFLENRKLTEEQKELLTLSRNNQLSLFTGKAGTGKTTVIKGLAEMLETNGANYHLLSFTGKAVFRMSKVTGIKAMTIHSFIGRGPPVRTNDVIIIDEIGMVTTKLFYDLIRHVGDQVRFYFIGDINQLPPIEAGYLIREIIRCNRIPVYTLTKNFRLEEKDSCGIAQNIELVLNPPEYVLGDREYKEFKFTEGPGFRMIESIDEDVIETEFMNYIEQGFDKNEVTVIAPYNRVLGTANNVIEDRVIPEDADKFTDHKNVMWLVGSRCMVIHNCYTRHEWAGRNSCWRC
jgi:exodeoxyribonuclease V alpha subunit